jgi:hypothetical protein
MRESIHGDDPIVAIFDFGLCVGVGETGDAFF